MLLEKIRKEYPIIEEFSESLLHKGFDYGSFKIDSDKLNNIKIKYVTNEKYAYIRIYQNKKVVVRQLRSKDVKRRI